MLNIDNVVYPITFNSYGVGEFTFTSRNNGVKKDYQGRSVKYNGTVDHFIEMNNKFNPNNSYAKDYHYKMASKREDNDMLDALHYLNIKPGQVNLNGAVFTASVGAKDYDYICKVENMPVGAMLLGVQRENGELDELKFKPRSIEVHDDVICLLSGCSGGYKSGNNYGAEINIKRGTNVKIKNSTNC